MAGKGKKFEFHGAFKKKSDAVKRERATPGSFIERVRIGHRWAYDVLTRKKGK